MKYILTTIALFLTMSIYSQSPCPVEGKGKNDKDIAANKLKNRDIETKVINTKVTLQSILTPGEDSKRFNQNDFVMITGYCVFIERGGKESCNCGSSIDTLQDNHIYIGLTPNAKKEDCMIVEITPRFKRLNKGFDLKQFAGKKINVYGYIFYDAEHKGNAKNTCDKCTNTWRYTCNEIHPVVKIELSK
jgi:hypothetical protein